MTGTVHFINRQRGMAAIATDYGYTIIELLGGEDDIEVGDVMRWSNDTRMGGDNYQNVTKGILTHVFVQNHFVPKEQLRQQLLM